MPIGIGGTTGTVAGPENSGTLDEGGWGGNSTLGEGAPSKAMIRAPELGLLALFGGGATL